MTTKRPLPPSLTLYARSRGGRSRSLASAKTCRVFELVGPPRAQSTEVSIRSPIHGLSQDRDTVMGSDGIGVRLSA
jgi:hypothetical protein